MPFSYPRNVRGFHAALLGEAKGLRERARRLRLSARGHFRESREDLREVRLFVARVMEEMADLAEKRVEDAEAYDGPVAPPEWEEKPARKRKERTT